MADTDTKTRKGAEAPASVATGEQMQAAQAEAQAQARADAEARIDSVIGAWVADHIHGSPVARDTASFNHLTQVAIPALRTAILGGE